MGHASDVCPSCLELHVRTCKGAIELRVYYQATQCFEDFALQNGPGNAAVLKEFACLAKGVF